MDLARKESATIWPVEFIKKLSSFHWKSSMNMYCYMLYTCSNIYCMDVCLYSSSWHPMYRSEYPQKHCIQQLKNWRICKIVPTAIKCSISITCTTSSIYGNIWFHDQLDRTWQTATTALWKSRQHYGLSRQHSIIEVAPSHDFARQLPVYVVTSDDIRPVIMTSEAHYHSDESSCKTFHVLIGQPRIIDF